jgi:hypothetical protein
MGWRRLSDVGVAVGLLDARWEFGYLRGIGIQVTPRQRVGVDEDTLSKMPPSAMTCSTTPTRFPSRS